METRTKRKWELIKWKSIVNELQNEDSDLDIHDVFHYLIDHTETSQKYLANYPEVVELLKQGLSLRKIDESTDISYATIKKVSIVFKYGDSTLNPNPYLLKHADIVKELMKGLTQREVADVSFPFLGQY